MSKRDKDRRDEDRDTAPAAPIRDATPSQSTVQKQAERDVGVRPEPTRSEPSRPDPVGYGNNRWGDSPPTSLSSMSGGGLTQSDPRPRPDPEPPEPAKPAPKLGRSHARGSTLGLKKEGRPAGQTKQDAPARKKPEPRKERRDAPKARKDARPEGQTKQDAPRVKREVVCKAPPSGKETRPKGGGGSGKRFVPYIGSKACK